MKSNKMYLFVSLSALIALGFITIAFVPQIRFLEIEKYNTMLKGSLLRLSVAIFLISIAYYSSFRKHLSFKITFNNLLWCIFPIALTIGNFPFIALILGDALIIDTQYIFLLIFYCLSSALVEEMIFIVLLFNYVFNYISKKKNAFVKSLIITSILFALWHLINLAFGAELISTLIQTVFYLLVGFLLIVTFYKTKNIWVCTFIHMLFSFGSLLISVLGIGNYHNTAYWIINIILWVFVGVLLIYETVKFNKNINKELD